MNLQEKVEDGQGALDAGCLQRVISILAALVQVSSGLIIHRAMYKSDQEMISPPPESWRCLGGAPGWRSGALSCAGHPRRSHPLPDI